MERVQRPLLGVLFLALGAGLVGVGIWSALEGGRAWVVAIAAAGLGIWLADLGRRLLRP
jgi:hypothetical protein